MLFQMRRGRQVCIVPYLHCFLHVVFTALFDEQQPCDLIRNQGHSLISHDEAHGNRQFKRSFGEDRKVPKKSLRGQSADSAV